MATKKKLLEAAAGSAGGGAGLNVEEVFATHLYVGTGDSTQNTIVNGLDLAGEGGMVWTKSRTNTYNNTIGDSHSGLTKYLYTNTNATHTDDTNVYYNSFNSNGYTVGQSGVATANELNNLNQDFVSWAWRKAEKWFDIVSWTGNGVAGRQISHSLGSVPGMIIMKSTSTAVAWTCYHRSLGNTKQVAFSQQNVPSTTTNAWNDTSPTDTHFTVGTGNNTSGRTYVAYIFAHHDDDGGFGPNGDMDAIKCGTYTTDSNEDATINLGFEPQWLLVKRIDGAGGAASYDWRVIDNLREWDADGDVSYLAANQATAEDSFDGRYYLTSTGFKQDNLGASREYIYMAIRRGPMAVPESATDVFAMDTLGGTSPTPPGWNSGFPIDMAIYKHEGNTTDYVNTARLIQTKYLIPNNTNAEAQLTTLMYDYQDGYFNATSTDSQYLSWMWKRAPSFCDVVAYTGNGTAGLTIDHNLGVKPEMIWVKRRNSARDWGTGFDALGWTKRGPALNSTETAYTTTTWWNDTDPTSTQVTLGQNATVNASGSDYIMYLFASVDGVSKVGSYTGDGTTGRVIDCGFSSGARFVLIKVTSHTGDWWLFDTERGITTSVAYGLRLNSAVAQVPSGSPTQDYHDRIDPSSSGFIVNHTSALGINESSKDYIFYAIA